VGLHDRVARAIIENGDFNHGLTYSGHPVAAAVAIANLKLLRDEKIVGRVKSDTGPYFQKKLRDTFANHPIIGDISGVGLVAGLQLAQEPKTRKHFANGGEVGTICRDFCFNGNLIMRATGDRMLLSPPLVITKQEIDEIVSKAKKAIDATAQQLGIS
jgi:putrescine aminotransferase